jgi:nitrogen-specific signal transduction histidine kinase
VPYAELGNLVAQMNVIVEQHHEQKLENERLQDEQTKFKLAQQVAHDIRSPLAALDVVVNQTNELPEENRLLIRRAVQRIRDIANDLSQKKQVATKESNSSVQNEETSVQLLSGLIDMLVSEKRLQYRDRIGIEIENHLDESSYGLFAPIQHVEFKRVLSNLINNAVEALGDNGRVEVKLSGGERINIRISDNGKGIPSEILPKLMQRGETHGKTGGSGLGLYHARTTVEKWGGSVAIESTIGKGTTITITLPKAESPSWFVEKISFATNSLIVVIDDDASIHQIWRNRFESYVNSGLAKLIHFSSPAEVISWHQNKSHHDAICYLCDYEFLNHDKTGLDIIRELNIAKESVLVTSRFEEDRVRFKCETLGVRMIPKNLAGFVPICRASNLTEQSTEKKPSTSIDAVLIDDDDLVHMNWKMAAKRQNKIVRVYSGSEEFWKEATALPKDTPIYVDSNLGDGIKGEDLTWMMGKKGFSNLHLATGYEASQFDKMPWLKGIVGKNPPWG